MRIAMLLLLAGMAGAAQAAVTDKGCAWIVEPTADRENILFPEITTRYLAAPLPAVPGGYVEIAGQFPHARYMSLQTYNLNLQTISDLRDVQIQPDAGSINPFIEGADRTAQARNYTVRVVDQAVPASGGDANTLYYIGDSGTRVGFSVVYRIYLPDAGTQPFGAVPAPTLTEVLPGGTRVPIPTCPDVVPDTSFLTEELAASGLSDYPLPPVGLFAQPQPQWRKYVNAPTGYADGLTNDQILGPLNPTLRGIALQLPAGLGENADNKYVYSALSREYGDVAVLRAKIPTTPKTYDGEPVMGGGQLRFWSMCSGNRATQTYDCLVDKDVPLASDGSYTIAVSTAGNRPANATPECGVGWLPWGADAQVTLIMRNMLPAADFTQSVQAADQGTEQSTLGPYYPVGTYYATVQDFENAVGCHAPAYLPSQGQAVAGDSPAGGGSMGVGLLVLGAAAARRRLTRRT
ncbi:MAG TPA: hypothetical protein VHE37_16705 [Nevskiaceae bacterium]|nr:hypothetical protein [Nevskiaceae bacterium]